MSDEKTTEKKKRPNYSKRGKQFERDVANALGHIFPNAERMLEYQASKVIGVDLENTGEFAIQCKRNAGYSPIGKIAEIRARDKTPVLVTKGNNLPAMAVLPFEAFIGLLERIPGMQQKDEIIAEAAPIETTATRSIPAPEIKEDFDEQTVFNGQRYSQPVKGEKDMDPVEAKKHLQGVTGLLTYFVEGIPENRIRLTYKDKSDGSKGTAFFHNEWTKSSGAARAMVSIEEWCDQYDAIPFDLAVRAPDSTEVMPEVVTQVENPDDRPLPPPEKEEALDYSFL